MHRVILLYDLMQSNVCVENTFPPAFETRNSYNDEKCGLETLLFDQMYFFLLKIRIENIFTVYDDVLLEVLSRLTKK